VSEVFLKYRKWPVLHATEVRSTLIMSGIQTVRAHGLFSQYAENLSPSQREYVLGLAAGIWVPIELAVEHYTALDRLALDRVTIESFGAEIASRTWKHIFAPVIVHARDGLRPWDALAHSHDTNDRSWRGTDIRIVREGPTQARYEWAGQPCAAIPYFMTSFAAFMRALVNLFSRRSYYEFVPDGCSRSTVTVRLSWIEKTFERRPAISQSFSLAPQRPGEDAEAPDARRQGAVRGVRR
jgi:hypothetical protein